MKAQNATSKGERLLMKRRRELSRRARATRKERWRAALHEAGHVIAARLVRKNSCVAAYLFSNGGGALLIKDPEGDTSEDAIVAAAGPAAEGFLDRLPEPPPWLVQWVHLISSSDQAQVILPKRDPAVEAQMTSKARSLISDDEWLRQWAKRMFQMHPECWREGTYWLPRVRHEAGVFVNQHAEFIERIAECLYAYGSIGPGCVEKILQSAEDSTTERELHD
jgi:hypothetical protein